MVYFLFFSEQSCGKLLKSEMDACMVSSGAMKAIPHGGGFQISSSSGSSWPFS